MRVLLFGSRGQVGWQLQRSLAPLGEVVAVSTGSQGLCGDLCDPDGIARTVTDVSPHVVVNAAAYTAVDRAEDEPEAAHAVNAAACEVLARASRDAGAWLVHYSTDYVYAGTGDGPWREDDVPEPLSVYGRTKLAGDLAVQRNPRHLVFRTSWVFDAWGQNFLKSILRAAMARDALRVVHDQWGAPTRAALIADVTAHALRSALAGGGRLAGVYHLTARGATSWHGYATLLLEEAERHGFPLRVRAAQVQGIPSSDYPARAPRPANSRLDTSRLRAAFDLELPPWEEGVRAVVAELAHQRSFLT